MTDQEKADLTARAVALAQEILYGVVEAPSVHAEPLSAHTRYEGLVTYA